MNCYVCDKSPSNDIPLLRCGCYVCPPCYCKIKDERKNHCLVCGKKLIRGKKLNKIEKNLK